MSLPGPHTAAGASGFAAILTDPVAALLAFDFDGVLSPIVDDPERAYVHPDVIPALRRLAPKVGGLAIVSGRPARSVVRLGGFAEVPELSGLRIIGQYGLERLDTPVGELRTPPEAPGVAMVRERLPALLAELPAPNGTAIEDKGHALVVHVRRTADPEAATELLIQPLTELAAANGLVVEPGRMVLELRPPGLDKGSVLRSLLTEDAARTVLYAGDDVGDLPAFDAVGELRERGEVAGLLICSASDEARGIAEHADLVVEGVPGVVRVLEGLADRLDA